MNISGKSAAIVLGIFTVGFGAMLFLSQNAQPPAKAQTIQSTPEQAAKGARCEAALKTAHIHTYQWSDGHATIVVGDAFRDAAFEEKSALTSLVQCAATEGRMDRSLTSIDYLDSRSHQSLGRWSVYGGLEIK